jgi:hypothetical protein
MPVSDEPKTRKRIITIRHETPSRRGIVLIVAQKQNELGDWTVPVITFDGPMLPMLESGRYARDVGIALIVAAWTYDQMMLAVKNSEEEKQSTDLSIEDE